MTGIEQLVAALGLLPGTQWLLTAFPTWLLPFVPLLASLGLWLVLKTAVEFRRPQFGKQYKGLWPGDLFLSFSLGVLIIGLVHFTRPDQIGAFWRSTSWNLLTLLAVVIFVGGLAAFEYIATLSKSSKTRTYTLYQLHTPTCLGHRLSMAVLTYLYMKVGIPALFSVPLPHVVFALVMLGLWLICIYVDNTRPRPRDLGEIHPYNGAWFGIGRKPLLTIASPARSYDDLSATRYGQPAPADQFRGWDDEEPLGGFAWRRDEPRTGLYGVRAEQPLDRTVVDAEPIRDEPRRLRVNFDEPAPFAAPAAPAAKPAAAAPRRTGGYDNIRSGGTSSQPVNNRRPAPRSGGTTGGYDSIK
jgi:hypothetical protein